MPAAIHQLEVGGPLPANVWLRTLVPHVATLFVRGHEFEDRYMRRFRDAWGREALREEGTTPTDEIFSSPGSTTSARPPSFFAATAT
jgi:hypothetical protein